jgi:hypothetical protein
MKKYKITASQTIYATYEIEVKARNEIEAKNIALNKPTNEWDHERFENGDELEVDEIEVVQDYVYISCDVMINILTEIRKKNLDIYQGWLFDLTDQIDWSLNILKDNKNRKYQELKNKYNKLNKGGE